MSFVMYSKGGDGVALLIRLQEEGEKTAITFKESRYDILGRGLIPQLRGLPKRDDIVLFDFIGQGRKACALISRGFRVIGGSICADEIELDRLVGLKLMEEVGVEVPQYFPFRSPKEALRFVELNKRPWVIKPNANELFVTVPKNADETIRALEFYSSHNSINKGLVLQEKVSGFEISTECWVDQGKLVPGSFTHTIEDKYFLAGDIGPQVGSMSSVVWRAQEKPWMSKIAEKLPNYTGPVDLNAIVKGERWLGLEWTPRFGYAAIYAMAALLEHPLSYTLREMEFSLSDKFAFALRISIPPYPLDSDKHPPVYKQTKDTAIENWGDEFWPLDFYIKKGRLVVAGIDGVVGEIVTTGDSIEEACQKAFVAAGKLELKDKQYRVDAGSRAKSQQAAPFLKSRFKEPATKLENVQKLDNSKVGAGSV